MTLRKKILPIMYVQVVLLFTSIYVCIQGIARPDVVQWIFIGSAVSMFWYAARHVPFPSLFHWFCVCYVALFYFYPILLPGLGISFRAADAVVSGYVMLTVGGVHLFIISYELFRESSRFRDPTPEEAIKVRQNALMHIVWLLVGVNLLGVALITIDAGSLSLSTIIEMTQTSRGDRKLESGPLSLLGTYLVILGGLVYVLLPVYAKKRGGSILPIVVLLFAIDVFLVIAYRARTPVVLHLIAVSVGFLYLRHRVVVVNKRRRRPLISGSLINSRQTLMRMALIIFAVGTLGIYMRTVRGYIGSTNDLSFLKQDFAAAVELAIAVDSSVGGDLGYTPTVFKVIEFVPEQFDYLGGQSYWRLLFAGVPRFVWPDKPLNTGIIVGRWMFPGTIVQSNPPGVMGDLYINFGYAGIIGFFVFGFIFARIDNIRSLAYLLVVATSFGLVFHFTRGSFTNVVLQFLVLYMTGYLIERYIRIR